MSRVVVSTFLSVDGVMEDPGGSENYEHGGWQLQFIDDDAGRFVTEQLMAADALLLGRVTYQGFAAAWPSAPPDAFTDRMNSMPKYVASTTLTETEWNAILLKGDVAEEVAKLKQQPGGNLLVMGSASLVHTLRENNLVDEYELWMHPIVLGSGKGLFKGGIDTTTLKLVNTRTTSKGVVVLTYEPAPRAKEGD